MTVDPQAVNEDGPTPAVVPMLRPTELAAPNDAGELTLIHPDTGRQIALSDATLEELGDFCDAIDEWKSRAYEAVKHAEREVLRRMDRDAKWTLYSDRFKFVGKSPAPHISYKEPVKLRAALLELAEAGLITRDAVDDAVPEKTVTSIVPGRLVALRKLGGRVAKTIEAFTGERNPTDRSVRVQRRG